MTNQCSAVLKRDLKTLLCPCSVVEFLQRMIAANKGLPRAAEEPSDPGPAQG